MRSPALCFLVGVSLVAVTSIAERALAYDKHECVRASDEGQALRIDGKLVRARERLLVCADKSCPALVRNDCAEWLLGLERDTPSVLLVAHDAKGLDVVGVTVAVDGSPTPLAEGRPLPLDPGPHTLRIAAPGFDAAETQIVVREGELRRPLPVTLVRRAPETADGAALGDRTQRSADVHDRSSATPWPTWGFAIAGGVGLAMFGGFALAGHLEYMDLKHSCAPACDGARYDSVNTKFWVADISLGVAIVAGGIATVLYLVDSTPRAPPSSAARGALLRF